MVGPLSKTPQFRMRNVNVHCEFGYKKVSREECMYRRAFDGIQCEGSGNVEAMSSIERAPRQTYDVWEA